jgi:hypothetical protein
MLRFMWDMHLHLKLPRWIACVAAFISYCSFFAMLFILQSWIYTILAWCCIHFFLEKFTEPTVDVGEFRLNQGVAWGIIAVITTTFNLYLQSHMHLLVICLFYIGAIGTIYTKIKVSYTRPLSYVPDVQRYTLHMHKLCIHYPH